MRLLRAVEVESKIFHTLFRILCSPVVGAWGFGVVVVLCDDISPLLVDTATHEFVLSNFALHVKCCGRWAVPVVVLFDPFLYNH